MKIKFQNLETNEILAEWELNRSQERFMNSKKKFVLFSGGYGCGKSLMLTLKAIDYALRYPNNYILMGRRTYPELRDTLLKEFFNICPDALIKDYFKAEGKVVFHNKSEIIFRHLDTVSESEIRSLNLGSAFIDQGEDIGKPVFDGLRGRLRREGVPDEARQIFISCNPALTWLFGEFKQNPKPEYEVIEASTLENAKNLPAGYIEDLMKYPESYRRQYVDGIWDMSLLSDNAVFAREHIEKLVGMEREPIREREGLKIFKEFVPGHRYQMGIDPAEGMEHGDNAVIVIVDLTEQEEVASFAAKVPPDVLADKATLFATWYSDSRNPILLVPEMNSIGVALINRLKDSEDRKFRFYTREEYDKTTQKKTEKIGWRTTRQSKPLLIARFQELLRLANPKVYSKETLAEFRSFVWSDEAKKQGAGAKQGFHDDRIIATLLAFWEKGKVVPGSVSYGGGKKESGIIVKNGKIFIPQLAVEKQTSWMTN